MANPLYRTDAEAALFKKLPADKAKDFALETETLRYEDTPRRRQIRLELLRLHDPNLQRFQLKVKTAKNADDILKHAGELDLSSIAKSDLAQLFFALGPDIVGSLVAAMLKQKDADIEMIAALSILRHEMLVSLQSVSSSSR